MIALLDSLLYFIGLAGILCLVLAVLWLLTVAAERIIDK